MRRGVNWFDTHLVDRFNASSTGAGLLCTPHHNDHHITTGETVTSRRIYGEIPAIKVEFSGIYLQLGEAHIPKGEVIEK